MAQRWRCRGLGCLALAALAACDALSRPAATDQGLQLRFEDRAYPAVFSREGPAVRDRPDGSAGLWVAVAGLPRPERALVVNPTTGAEVTVALFAAASGSGPAIRLSNEAADALGVAAQPVPVRITALRRQLQIDTTGGRF
jgi:hypothetical protein